MSIRALQERLERLTGKPLRVARELPTPLPAPPETPRGAHPLANVVECSSGSFGLRRQVYRFDDEFGRAPLGLLMPDRASRLAPLLPETCDPNDLVYLDTEATGLSTGAGTYAFLVGLGRLVPSGFEVTQYLMRDVSEEEPMLEAVAADLARSRVLVTYNGKAFDWPLLRGRFRLNGVRAGEPAHHLDMLVHARRLWRRRLGTARLMLIEEHVLGHERTGDLNSWMIPEAYFHFVHEGREDLMDRILHHNALDIVALAAVTGLGGAHLAGEDVPGFPTDPLAMARLAELQRRPADAAREYRRAIEAGMKPAEIRELLPRLARVYRRAKDHAGAAWALSELLARTSGLYLDAYEPLARLSERQLSDPRAAREWCVKGLTVLSRGLASLGGRVEALRERLRRRIARLDRVTS